MKTIVLDVETTGVDSSKHTIWEISYAVFQNERDLLLYDGSKERIKTLYLEPGLEWDPKAFEMYKKVQEEIEDKVITSKECFALFKSQLDNLVDKFDKKDKIRFMGYNVDFDWQFMYSWFSRIHNDPYMGSYFWYPPQCVCKLAFDALKDERKNLQNFKLGTVATHFGIPVMKESLHEAHYDVLMTSLLYKKIYEKRRWQLLQRVEN